MFNQHKISVRDIVLRKIQLVKSTTGDISNVVDIDQNQLIHAATAAIAVAIIIRCRSNMIYHNIILNERKISSHDIKSIYNFVTQC